MGKSAKEIVDAIGASAAGGATRRAVAHGSRGRPALGALFYLATQSRYRDHTLPIGKRRVMPSIGRAIPKGRVTTISK